MSIWAIPCLCTILLSSLWFILYVSPFLLSSQPHCKVREHAKLRITHFWTTWCTHMLWIHTLILLISSSLVHTASVPSISFHPCIKIVAVSSNRMLSDYAACWLICLIWITCTGIPYQACTALNLSFVGFGLGIALPDRRTRLFIGLFLPSCSVRTFFCSF
jgi:hypothetical protein